MPMELKLHVMLVISVVERDWPSNQNAKLVINVLILCYKSIVTPDIFPKQKQQYVPNVHQELRQVLCNLNPFSITQKRINLKSIQSVKTI